MIRISGIKLKIDHDKDAIYKRVCKVLKITHKDILELHIAKKSIDARDKSEIKFVYSIDILIENETRFLSIKHVSKVEKHTYRVNKLNGASTRPVVVGSGPAGIFAALILAQANLKPIIIERGKDVDSRKNDVDTFWKTGKLNENSNVQFGEGGAGTFSDGKLTTGIKDVRIRKVLEELVKCGAPKEILINQKPHIGTDKLIPILKQLRQKIIALGGEFRFLHTLVGFTQKNNKLQQLIITDNSSEKSHNYTINTSYMVLAIGHSARDTFKMLYENKVAILPKSFAVGVRIEHSQDFINKSQYGNYCNSPYLGAAEYKLSTHLSNGRSVYTFCMCPGGLVVAASSEKEGVVVNGMSYYKRDLKNANSALLVSINPSDFPSSSPLAGIEFQRNLEKQAFILGGSSYRAPAQLVGDFLNNKKSTSFKSVSPTYKPGVVPANLQQCFNPFIVESLKEGLIDMDKKIKGFASYDSILTGVESRSSSPIKIIRGKSLNSNIEGIIPCGEGAGYAGGITSAAVDGIKCAEQIIEVIQ